MSFVEAKRIRNLPPYLFARIEQLIADKKAQGVDVISLGIGDPDVPTPDHIIEAAEKELKIPANHQYPSSAGMPAYRRAVADWYARRFGVELDPQREVVSLIGSKEGIAHLPWCFVDPGDVVLVPDPGYPVYAGGTILAGGIPHPVPLTAGNGFLPDLAAIPAETARRAKVMFINYPNNPTGAVASKEFFARVVDFAREYGILVCHDAAYSEIAFDGYRPPSFLEVAGAREVGIEFHSVSKTYNMTGWRAGWAAGNAGAVEALGRLKSNLDSGVFQVVQYAAIAALNGPQDGVQSLCEMYRERRDLVVDTLNDLGWRLTRPRATFYIWAPVPAGHDASSFAEMVLEKAGVVITPGTGYGTYGEGYFRISLTLPTPRLVEAMERLRGCLGRVTF
ncbi:aminotransferase, class I and II [Candidatus Desulforudis audaxviator MP104C]|uniref:LL-diaminopimelate aminotransferase n=1 Tax=Desulforudis audaxviator (strain MP104C) TaxID=477974 RepID=DAPAT_DESAP|nr:LL-diaminopimelate aminotransferase [Candidatus Desulforudis audaxviator]B1I544.1 RecName: Full=LL-diaminopimelate aminotransferase; Short=DAP-AT; Short=DAP-aminotransferase; Short=LL-DAP-aminotransferase [Candidatus Desulforudis audaxviator MP104C]ACA60105.1 aminotransferase, class I and II [Candidatus Desulforudis audaxviator MP104C]